MSTRQLHFNAFLHGCGHHQAAWRLPGSSVEQLEEITYYERLAQTAEAGLFDAIFFADGQAVRDPAVGPQWSLEPLTALAAIARNTSHIGLNCTDSTTFPPPLTASRMLFCLLPIIHGRHV